MKLDITPIRHLYPFRPHYLDRDGLNYHYLDEGAGEPVVMVHGNPTWSFYFRRLIQALAPEYRTIVPDHIGCGRSDKPTVSRYDYRLQSRVADLTALLDHLDCQQKITLVVHDWGGMIGLAWALQHPEKIGRLVITNTSGFLPPGGKGLPLRLRMLRSIKPFAGPAVLGGNLFARCALLMAPRKRLPREVQKGLIAPYSSGPNRIATLKFVQDIPLTPEDPSYALVRQVDRNLFRLAGIPMLILWGRHDFVFDLDYFAEWRRRFPSARTFLFNDAGHYLFEDVPAKITARIRHFLQTAPL